MSSGACRALVAIIFALIAVGGSALGVAAQQENLRTRSLTIYRVDPQSGRIRVQIVITAINRGDSRIRNETFGPIYIEDNATPTISGNAERVGTVDVPGPWRAIDIRLPNVPPNDQRSVDITYTIRGGDRFPVVLEPGYAFACVNGQPTDTGSISIEIADNFGVTTSGTELEETSVGLASERSSNPAEIFTCIEGTRPARLERDQLFGPGDREITLQAYTSGWSTAAGLRIEPALDQVRVFLGQDIPGVGPVIIRETPPRSKGGFAGDHGTPGVVQVDESAGVRSDIVHEVAHAWFTTLDYPERWMREGLAEWTSSSIAGAVCAPVRPDTPSPDLSDWLIVKPTSPEDIEERMAEQDAAACGVISALEGAMPADTFKDVIGTLLTAEAKYVGSGAPGSAPTTVVDFREFLDAVDERGLVPSGVEDLDLAQDLLVRFGIPNDPLELEERSATRARYHDFLSRTGPMAAPLAVRQAMDDWRFRDANRLLDRSEEILAALTSADELVPSAGLLTIIQDEFEGARSAAGLDDVLERASTLLEDATEIVDPLAALATVEPADWSTPAAIDTAIRGRRFDDVITAVEPAMRISEDVSAADVALPTANLLATYQPRYENSPTIADLEELSVEVAQTRRQAEATASELARLRSQVGDWRIPDAVTAPVAAGQIAAALTISRDARAVISAVREADQSLPEAAVGQTFKSRFEAVMSGAEMATLRAEAEAARDQAVAVGDALRSLRRTVGDWTLPTIVTEPIDQRDFVLAAATSSAARRWVENAAQADASLPEIAALESVRPQFESATTLEELEAGAQLAFDWAQAAGRVAAAIQAAAAPRDLLTVIGLFGTDVNPQVEQAIAAAREGKVAEATQLAVGVIDTINNGSSSGGLRLIGLIFLGVAVFGVLGLLVIFRREAGPPWARSSKPPWAE